MAKTIQDEERDAEFGRRIRLRRESLSLTIAELAERVGVTYGQIVSLENGEVAVRASALETIAGALEIPLSYFYQISGPGIPISVIPAKGAFIRAAAERHRGQGRSERSAIADQPPRHSRQSTTLHPELGKIASESN